MTARLDSFPVIMHLAPGYRAGDPRLFHQECSTLTRAGYRVQLVAHASPEEHLQSVLELHRLESLGQSSLRFRVLKRIWRCWRAYTLARQSPASIFHIHSPEFIRWGIRLGRKLGRKVVFDCREDFEGYVLQRSGIPNVLRRPAAFFVRRELEWAARHCDALIVADQGTGDRLKGQAQRTLVLHNFPRLDFFPYRKQSEETKQFDIVYHGSLPKYHLRLFLAIDNALIRLGAAVRWRLINKASPAVEWFRNELARTGASQRFTIDGPVPHERIAEEVCKARIGIIPLPDLPKFQNNIPRKVFEFMALGMPVVMSDLPPTRPFVRNGESALLVKPDDAQAYAQAILTLLGDAELRDKMGSAGRKLVEEEYNWEKESQKLLHLYSELLTRPQG